MQLEQFIDRRKTHSVKWYLQNEEIIPLCIADMDFQVSDEIRNAISQKAIHGIYGYSTFCDRYFNAILYWWETNHQWKLEKDWICFSPGIIPGMNLLLKVLAKPGDHVIIQEPVYYPFYETIQAQGCHIQENSLIYKNGKYEIDFDDFEKKASHPSAKVFILCSPHNPVGRVWTKDELKQLGDICRKHNVFIISDEMHCDLTYSGFKHTPMAQVDPAFLNNTITCSAPSKTFNIAGMQSSIIIIPNKEIRENYQKMLVAYGLMRPNAFAIEATIAAYYKGMPWLEQVREYLNGNLKFVTEFLKENIPEIKPVYPEATHLIWLDCRELPVQSQYLHSFFLEKAAVRLDEGRKFGPGGEGFERINIACPRDILETAWMRIKNAIDTLKHT